MRDNIRLSIRGILAHKMRSFLTMLGIIIGIASIIAIVSTIKGTNEQIEKNLIGSGDNMVRVILYQNDFEYDMGSGIPTGISEIKNDTKFKLKKIKNVKNVSIFKKRQEFETIYCGDKKLNGANILGIDQNYLSTMSLSVAKGRGLTNHDADTFNKSCLLDAQVAAQLFGDKNGIGKTIEIHGVPFTVVGIVKNKKKFEPEVKTLEDYYLYNSNSHGENKCK